MRSILRSGLVAGLSLAFALTAVGQNQNSESAPNLKLPTQGTLPQTKYEYQFISQHYIWSNQPLRQTAGKICQTMKDRAFNESPYAINGEQDWNSCLNTQIQSIGYMRWLQNDGFKASRKNRESAKAYLEKNYTMGRFGSYTLSQLRSAVQASSNR